MLEQEWISFYEAAHELTKRFDCGWAEAKVILRQACRDAKIDTMKAPLDPDRMPSPFWTKITHREWRDREVDEDGPDADGCKIEVMVRDDDFRRWLNRQETAKQAPKDGTRRLRQSAKQAINALWPGGIPGGVSNGEINQKVSAHLKAHHLSKMSRDTILRAAGRKQ
jgi:hypothetical protein